MRHLPTQSAADKAFAIALVLKGIDALSEVAGGLWLLVDPHWRRAAAFFATTWPWQASRRAISR